MCNGQLWQDVSHLKLLKVYMGLIDLDKFTAEKSIKDFKIQGTLPYDSISCKATVNQMLEDYLREVSIYIYSMLTFFPSNIEERQHTVYYSIRIYLLYTYIFIFFLDILLVIVADRVPA